MTSSRGGSQWVSLPACIWSSQTDERPEKTPMVFPCAPAFRYATYGSTGGISAYHRTGKYIYRTGGKYTCYLQSEGLPPPTQRQRASPLFPNGEPAGLNARLSPCQSSGMVRKASNTVSRRSNKVRKSCHTVSRSSNNMSSIPNNMSSIPNNVSRSLNRVSKGFNRLSKPSNTRSKPSNTRSRPSNTRSRRSNKVSYGCNMMRRTFNSLGRP